MPRFLCGRLTHELSEAAQREPAGPRHKLHESQSHLVVHLLHQLWGAKESVSGAQGRANKSAPVSECSLLQRSHQCKNRKNYTFQFCIVSNKRRQFPFVRVALMQTNLLKAAQTHSKNLWQIFQQTQSAGVDHNLSHTHTHGDFFFFYCAIGTIQ